VHKSIIRKFLAALLCGFFVVGGASVARGQTPTPSPTTDTTDTTSDTTATTTDIGGGNLPNTGGEVGMTLAVAGALVAATLGSRRLIRKAE
jgi:LPXTG-motif cell wall-anchored protein